MKLKYRNKTYSSEDVPMFLYFKTASHKRSFVTTLVGYKLGTFTEIKDLHSALAGNVVIKDKRAKMFFCIDDKDEKDIIQKCVYEEVSSENNAIICSPPDIKEDILIEWVQKNLDKLS